MVLKKYITPPKLARILGVNVEKIYAPIGSGELPAINLSSGRRPRYKIALADVEAFLESRRVVPKQPQPQPVRRRRKNQAQLTFIK